MGKVERQQFIRHLISSRSILSQEELKAHLLTAGYNVAQATLSRDIKEMCIAKTSSGYHLMDASREPIADEPTMEPQIPHGSVHTVEFGIGIAVLRTAPGHASMVAAMIDDTMLPPIMGTIAGDDTVLLMLRPAYNNEDTTKALSSLISGLQVVNG